MNFVAEHYQENKLKYLKRLSFRAGTEWDAEDVLHDAYERAIRYYASYDDSQDFGAWFNTILNNALREHKNASKGHFISLDEIEEEAIPCPHYSTELLKEIYQRIKAKNPIQQEVLMLHFKHEYSALQISQITDCNYSNCRSIIAQFKKELKRKYID
jgi:RNA polymerase sigma factor (sigma-70 family)